MHGTGDTSGSWLLRWLDAQGAKRPKDVDALLRSEATRADLLTALMEADVQPPSIDRTATAAIAAGATLDLSGWFSSGMSAGCMKAKLDTLLHRTWHYFDRIYVVGPSALYLQRFYAREPELKISLAGANDKLTQIDRRPPATKTVDLAIPTAVSTRHP